MNFINNTIGILLGYLMWACLLLTKNYGAAIIVFTFATRLLMFPINIKVQKNSIKMIRLQPELNRISARNAGNKDKAAEEQLALYKREKYSPMSGVIPMLIQIPIILGLIAVIYNPLEHLLHLNPELIEAFVSKAAEITMNPQLGSGAQLKVIELIQNPAYTSMFSSVAVSGVSTADAISLIRSFEPGFLGLDLTRIPLAFDAYALVPLLSGASAFVLCVLQNRENVLQKEQAFWSKWGMTLFLTAFSLYFTTLVPAGIGLYWTAGNILSIVTLYLLNFMYDPKKYIDYEALEESKKELEASREIEKKLKPTKEQKERAKRDYAAFCRDDNTKQLVYYSEKSGFYKYFKAQTEAIIENSDIIIHYVTSDPDDQIFGMNNPRIIPYYIDDNRLIPLFMKIDADAVVMTTPSIQVYHLKRSLVRKDAEYIYTPHDPLSIHMSAEKGAFDHFDTVLCVGQHQLDELRETEQIYGLKEKNLIECGYSLIDELIADYEKTEKVQNAKKRILIAPSWHDGNLLEEAVFPLLDCILEKDYDITVRPHPEFIKRYPARMQKIIGNYEDRLSDNFRIETDFSSNVTIFTADLVITDWSGIAFEFAYSTKKPCLFVNTPMKVMNKEYTRLTNVPIEISLREKIGMTLDTDKLGSADEAIENLFKKQDFYKKTIETVMSSTLFNIGSSGRIAADYIISAASRKKKVQ